MAPAHQPLMPASTSTAPTDDGQKLATIPRGPGRELRVRWREFKGHYFADLREWTLNEHTQQWWPSKSKSKGITVKAHELAQVAAALEAARTAATSPRVEKT
jgi:hypothetical protein